MNVYKITPTTRYSSGNAFVAAPSVIDAEILFRNDDYRDYKFEDGKCKIIQLHDIYCDTNKPKLIIDDIMLD